ncbi:bacillithiol system redox-active protein YtxJ [Alkalihalobacillus sp. LMS39]|uniref:bacillithiol system redox-active protein YtxJ n=1 Tax=Alkalihalobacillus sp. LMS39 TaxID=2924032 RepID=UPI001FB3EA15|nr:bacillithiol system redox-active protein YtxJ [Alkalihalobacillus sp. LMS39]UOE93474.1 bacillithiol system redox-active protein YtxJ [Alkalihalobacillus sp. LMS39]
MSIVKITSQEELDQIKTEHDKFILFKNSTTCPISEAAFEEFKAFAKANETLPLYYLNVQEARPLSNAVAEQYGVKHESPQALLFKGNEIVWNQSHWKVTVSVLEQQWNA